MASIRIGCSGWNYRSWAGDFYPPRCPQRLWLEHYATAFDTVEINTTFYRLPRRDAVARWVEQTPDGFLFTVKASRYLTHMKRLTDMGPGVDKLWERLEPLTESTKGGPILWQLPPNFRRDDERLSAALDQLPPGQHHAFEFRHPSWFEAGAPTLELLRQHGVALVIGDRPEVHAFQPLDAITADFTLVRFHHGSRGRRGNYSETEIAEWAERIGSWRRAGTSVFAYFNNDWEGFAPRNAARLQQLVQAM
ncbi:DUF72 domain-containing protein [Conexibacter woesei]|uniref:DUF72 domain-containing protein n=1 Tax=Conexibacter woesei TaxID=191495 RepID=UPI000419A142|nr:DUF72 domain-containing protein [Conexibacter woesei]